MQKKNTFCFSKLIWKLYLQEELCNVLLNWRLRNFHEFFIESLKANAQQWKVEDVFFWGNFIILSPFPHPSPAFPKQPENCQLYHNFYLLHRCATPPPPSIHIFSFNQWSMVEKRIFRYFPCDYLSIFNPDNSGLFCGPHKFRASAMLVSLKAKHLKAEMRTWMAVINITYW